MIDLNPIFEDLSQTLKSINIPKGDLSDVGNELGIIVGKYISKEMGFEYDDLIAGIRHGISLTKGTH